MRPEERQGDEGSAERQRRTPESERRVGGPHGSGGGGLRKTAPWRSSLGPSYLCLRVRSPDRPAGTRSPRGRGGEGVKKRRGAECEEEEQLTPPNQGERLMAGTVTTRKHATHARTLDATKRGACAQACKLRPFTPSLRPSTRCGLSEAAPPHLTVVRMRIFHSLTFSPPFSPCSAQWGMRITCSPRAARLFPPFTGLRKRVGVHTPFWGCLLRMQGLMGSGYPLSLEY